MASRAFILAAATMLLASLPNPSALAQDAIGDLLAPGAVSVDPLPPASEPEAPAEALPDPAGLAAPVTVQPVEPPELPAPSAAVAPVEAGGLDAVPAAIAVPELRWRVENPFRLFVDPADTEVHRATYLALNPAERTSPILAAERELAARHPDGWARTMVDRTCWDDKNNRYTCTGTSYIHPESHAVIVRLAGVPDAAALTCLWRMDPPPGVRGKSVNKRQPCGEDLRVEIPYPHGGRVEVAIGGRTIAGEEIRVTDVFIVGMGDSFGSGEGNPDVPVRFSRERTADYGDKWGENDLRGYPARIGTWSAIGDRGFIEGSARWHDQACHRSLYSHQLRVALQLAVEDDHRAVTYVGLACSGAEVIFGLFLRYKGNEWVPNPPRLSQISAAAEAQCGKHPPEPHDLPEAYHMRGKLEALKGGLVLHKCPAERARKIDLLLLSIGGNDIGFARLLANAILVDQSLLRQLGGWFGQVFGVEQATGAMAQLGDRYKSLNRALRNILHIPWNESDRIILTAYPGLALLGDGTEVCPDGRAGMEVVPAFALSALRARQGVWVADRLHRTMQLSARAHGWGFIESHRAGFIGRGICAGFTDSAYSAADDLRLPRRINGAWVPYNPADYRPYASRQRWFRTPNDAFLTGNFHVAQSVIHRVLKLESLSWFQLLLAATYSGAFHPTAEGHAAIADAALIKAREVLARYGQARPRYAGGR